MAAAVLTACINRQQEAKSNVAGDLQNISLNIVGDVVKPAGSMYDFSINMFERLHSEAHGNMVCSPLGAATLMRMLQDGANGETAKELGLMLGTTTEEIGQIAHDLQGDANVTGCSARAVMANLLAVNDNCKLRKDYQQHVGKVYGAEAWQLDFSDKNSETRINKWVSEKTNGMIGGLATSLDSKETMRACNTLYFKGYWTHPFKGISGKDLTTIKTFTQADGKKVLVNMMQRQKYFKYTHNDTLQVVSLPYENRSRDTLHQRNFSMYVFLPRQGKTLDDVVKYLHSHSLAELSKSMNRQDVEVSLPRFTSGITLDLKSVMRSLGVRHLDDFSGISSNYMELSGVIQQAKIIVNEQGTEAAALTEAFNVTGVPQPHYYAIFNANHPFIYMIVCDDTNTIYFMGEYTKGMVQENGEWMVKESTLSEEKEDTEENLREWDNAEGEVLKAKDVIAMNHDHTEVLRTGGYHCAVCEYLSKQALEGKNRGKDFVYDIVEQMPSFPGGHQALFDYLDKNIKYPAKAVKNKIQGRVIVQFIVDEKGNLSDIKVVKSVEPYLDAEAVRVVKSMPRWNPGMQNGKAVKVRYTLPVTFRLQ